MGHFTVPKSTSSYSMLSIVNINVEQFSLTSNFLNGLIFSTAATMLQARINSSKGNPKIFRKKYHKKNKALKNFKLNNKVTNLINTEYSKEHELKNGFERPVIIHRAIFGSLERFMAILCEETAGKWDFWLSPRQLQIIPLGKEQ